MISHDITWYPIPVMKKIPIFLIELPILHGKTTIFEFYPPLFPVQSQKTSSFPSARLQSPSFIIKSPKISQFIFVTSRVSHGFPMVFLGFPMVFLGFMLFPWFSLVFPWFPPPVALANHRGAVMRPSSSSRWRCSVSSACRAREMPGASPRWR